MFTVPEDTYVRSMVTRTTSDLDTISYSCDIYPTENCITYFDFGFPSLETYIPTFKNPLIIECTYETDLNLVTIHQIIKDRIFSLMRSVNECETEIILLSNKITSGFITPIDVKFYSVKIGELSSQRELILKENYWDRYCRGAIPILNKYVELMSNEYKGQIKPGCNVPLDESKILERLEYIKKYINYIKSLRIIDAKILKTEKIKNICPGCQKELYSDSTSDYDGSYKCRCGFSENNINHSTEYNDVNKLVPQITGNSKHIKTFTEWLDRFLCRSGDEYPQDEMFSKFDLFCTQNNFPNRFNVLNGYIPQPDSSVIICLLQNNGYSKYYSIKNSIRKDYYGWEIPEINSTQENRSLELYLSIQEKYPQFKDKERKTNINLEIIGYTILKMVGVNLMSSDFKIPINSDTLAYSKDTLYNILISLGYDEMSIPEMNY